MAHLAVQSFSWSVGRSVGCVVGRMVGWSVGRTVDLASMGADGMQVGMPTQCKWACQLPAELHSNNRQAHTCECILQSLFIL